MVESKRKERMKWLRETTGYRNKKVKEKRKGRVKTTKHEEDATKQLGLKREERDVMTFFKTYSSESTF